MRRRGEGRADADTTDGGSGALLTMTSFFDAIAAGDYDEVETHLNAGADPNAPGSANLPPLHAAVAASEGELLRLLASRGADLERRDGWKRTALMLAAASNEVECAEMLVALGADPAEAQELAGDNEELLANPYYLGLNRPRATGDEY